MTEQLSPGQSSARQSLARWRSGLSTQETCFTHLRLPFVAGPTLSDHVYYRRVRDGVVIDPAFESLPIGMRSGGMGDLSRGLLAVGNAGSALEAVGMHVPGRAGGSVGGVGGSPPGGGLTTVGAVHGLR